MRSVLRPLFVILAAALLASACATTPSGPATFTVGTLTVHRYGDHGRPLILIPGLGSGAWVWDGAVAQFEGDHVIYVLTLAGFDGTPLPTNHQDLMGQADSSLLELIRSHNIDHPVLVGHSLGGTLALQFASEHSDLLGGVVAVDGLPVFPGTQDMSAEQRAAIGKGMSAKMAALSPEQFREQQLAFMQTIGLIDPAMAAKYAALQDQSDPAAVAEYAGEDLALDLRPQLKNIGAPVLEISPYNPPDFAKDSKLPISEAQKTAYYQMLLAGIPKVEVESISPSRHFAMLDQPQKFYDILNAFLATLPAAPAMQ